MKMLALVVIAAVIIVVALALFPKTENRLARADAETLIIPVTAHLITEPSGYYISYRDASNVEQLLEQVNGIWEQAAISFQVEEVIVTPLSENAVPNALNDNTAELRSHLRPGVNLFFAQSLNNINGLALMDLNAALISDFTTVNDYRTTAHELGHLLGLRHVSPSNRLMARGRNGELLSNEEILAARERAQGLLSIEG